MSAPVASRWAPSSPCGPACLPRRSSVSQAGPLRRVSRLAAAAAMLLVGGALAAAIPLFPVRTGRRLVRSWFRGLLGAFGVRIVRRMPQGRAEARPGTLVVANHVSWLDIVVLQSLYPMRMLAKKEMLAWPLLGVSAARAGTLAIDRDRLRALPEAVQRIAEALRAGSVVGAFPEGTTWCGLASGRHRPAVYQAALDAGARVQPVALRFRTGNGDTTTAAAFVGEATLLESVAAVARLRHLVIEVVVLPAFDADGVRDRRELARLTEAAITAVIRPSGGVHWTSTPIEVAGSPGDHDRARVERPVEPTAA